MASVVPELEASLSYMQSLKPPGVSGSKINSLTTLCVNNVQSESVLIQKIFTHFKKAPGTHKLGVLYVVDSVTRRWFDQAKQQGQQINASAPDGTYAAGVHRVTELLPVLMNDILQTAPAEQKDKIKKLVDIWEKGQTFPTPMIEQFKQKLNTPTNQSTTPTGSPPPGPGLPGLAEKPATAAPNAIMEALANIARQNITAAPGPASVPAPTAAAPTPTPASSWYGAQPASTSQNATPVPAPYQAPPPASMPGMPFQFPGQPPVAPAGGQIPGFPGLAPPAPAPAAPGLDPSTQQQVALIQLLASQGIPYEKIPGIIAAMQSNGAAAPAAAPPAAPYGAAWGQDAYRNDSRDKNDLNNQTRSPRYGNRERSRSPSNRWDTRGSPRGRNDREWGAGPGRNSPAGRDGRGRGQDYRQRSPQGRRGHSPPGRQDHLAPGEKWIEFDQTLPNGSIKVLSRTLFVGGVTCSEGELRNIFTRHGHVQTCIVNKDKRHAFVKMMNRRDAVSAKEAMENGQFRTRWGVGFGPRDCSDYQTGISVIPITKLTDADRKWMLSAEFGGSGGRPIETGMVVEEPDIEIGAGVSSKAISRRMQTDRSGRHGPKSTRGQNANNDHGDGDDDAKFRRTRESRRDERRDINPAADPSQPSVAEFPFGIGTGPNGMPVFPAGFAFPAPRDGSNGY